MVQVRIQQCIGIQIIRVNTAGSERFMKQMQMERIEKQFADEFTQRGPSGFHRCRREPLLAKLVGQGRLLHFKGFDLEIRNDFVRIPAFERKEVVLVLEETCACTGQIGVPSVQGVVGAAANGHDQFEPRKSRKVWKKFIQSRQEIFESVCLIQGIKDEPDFSGNRVIPHRGVQSRSPFLQRIKRPWRNASFLKHGFAQQR